MAKGFGSVTGPVYCLGKLTVATVGTVVPLNTNVEIFTGFGTPTTGVPGLTTSGQRSTMCANRIKVANASATGNLFLVFKGQAAAAGNGTSVVLVIPPNSERVLECPNLSNPFQLDQFALDTDANGTVGYVTAIII